MKVIINVFKENIIDRLPTSVIKEVSKTVIKDYINRNACINIIFTDDKFIKKINSDFLNHNYATDVISFILDDDLSSEFIGEIYISFETAQTQASELNLSIKEELLRLVIHGCLHLCGFEDTTDLQKNEMTNLENKYLNIILN